MPTSPIGGQFISSFGGALGFRRFQNMLPPAGAEPPTVGQLLVDVARWEMERTGTVDDTTHTGTWGWDGNGITCFGFRLAAELIWNLYEPPNFIVQYGGLFSDQTVLDSGMQFWAYVGSGVNYPTSLPGPHYYFCPSAKGRMVQTIIDAAGKKKVRARIDIIGNAPIFAMGPSLNEQAQYDAYIAHCITRGWVW